MNIDLYNYISSSWAYLEIKKKCGFIYMVRIILLGYMPWF